MVEIPPNLEQILTNEPPYVVYVLKCQKPGHVYIGYTNDFYRRIKQHESGKGAEFTRVRGVEKLIYLEPHKTKQKAMERETALTVYFILQLGDFNKVGGGKYPQVIKPLSAREEILEIIKRYEQKVGGDAIL